MTKPAIRLKCDSVPYRKGFIEVVGGIHDGCVNLESWVIHAERELDEIDWVADERVGGFGRGCEYGAGIDGRTSPHVRQRIDRSR